MSKDITLLEEIAEQELDMVTGGTDCNYRGKGYVCTFSLDCSAICHWGKKLFG